MSIMNAMRYARMYAEGKKEKQTLHPLRNDFGASSPYVSVVSKLCIPLGTTLELLHLIFRWYLSSASP